MICSCADNEGRHGPGQSIDTALLEPIFTGFTEKEGNLITVLQKAQEIYGWLPAALLAYIARRTGIKPSKVKGVATFYTQFRLKPAGKHRILICQGTACHVNGSSAIEEAVKAYLRVGEGEISENGMFTYNNVACLGCCSLSPVIMIDDKVYGNLTAEAVSSILKVIEQKEAAQ